MSCLFIVGTRPEAIKLAPVIAALDRCGGKAQICTTGQHRDLLPPILQEYGLEADHHAGGDDDYPLAALQTVIRQAQPAALVVQGDTRSAFLGAVAARLESVPLAHVEAGLRSGSALDPFPEEIFRIGIGRLADLHFAPTAAAREHLLTAGAAVGSVHVTGNPVYDAALSILQVEPRIAVPTRSILMTVHRAENGGARLQQIYAAASDLARAGRRVIYIRHPRITDADISGLVGVPGLAVLPPQRHRDFLRLMTAADLVLTDSGGVHEEAAYLRRPSLILRDRTERPELLVPGFSELVGAETARIVTRARALLGASSPLAEEPLRDGRAGERIAAILAENFSICR